MHALQTYRWIAVAVATALLPVAGAAVGQDTYEPRDADHLIRDVFSAEDTSRYGEAIEAYVDLLGGPHSSLSRAEQEIRSRHLSAFFSVMPSEDRDDLKGSLNQDRVRRWWRAQDPLPGTRRNERLEEHLARYVYASGAFSSERDERGFDDRGEIFVRLGPPMEKLTIRLSETIRAFDLDRSISVPDLQANELWLYPHIDDEAYYFFLQHSRRNGYRLALPSELIPSRLRSGLDARTTRGRDRAEMLLIVMEEVYAQLALAHPFFGSTLDRIAQFRGRPLSSTDRPDHFAQSTISFASSRESESEGRRLRVVPASITNSRGITDDLPVEVRWARFLDDDGTTRTEIYWTVHGTSLEPSKRLVETLTKDGFEPSDDYLLSVAVARRTPDLVTKELDMKHYRIQPSTTSALTAQSFVVRGDTSRYNLGIQWNQYWTASSRSEPVNIGALLKIGTTQIDSIPPLHGRGERFESSDLKPIRRGGDVPFPARELNGQPPPDLYFELYNLHYGEDDMAHYTIEYDVAAESGGRSTSARSSHTVTERHTRERIGVELGDWQKGDRVEITVRATDDVTGETVSRSISFVM